MLRNQKPLQGLLFVACLLPTTHVAADVLSSFVTNELVEPWDTYDRSAPTLINMRVKTVIEAGPCVAGEYAGCTLNDVLNDIDGSDDFKPEIKVHMTADGYPNDGLVSNAELRQRGATSRGAPQKSFRVKLDRGVTPWRGGRRIQLTKSFWDFSRIRNKLSYDLFVDVPNLPSMRTQFINLNVEDQGSVENYGLYTQVEYVGEDYLLRRGWNKDSRLYKAENFYFKNNPALALDAAGEPLDEAAFEQVVEIKNGKDHRKLVNMLKDLNNPALDFNSQVFNKYFNKDNYLSWLATNILLDNFDANFHNFYLMNLKGSQKFYFLPWDYDLSLGTLSDTGSDSNRARWSRSHANWWGQELHQQFLRQPGNLVLLRDAMDEIKSKFLSNAKLQQKADSYYNIVFPLISSSPDIDRLYIGGTNPEKIAAYNRIFSSLAGRVQSNYDQFLASFGDPMPFVMNKPEVSGNSYRFSWSPSESLLGQQIRYDVEVSTTPSFNTGTIVASRYGVQGTSVTIPWTNGAGRYYYRVIARDPGDPNQNVQEGYNQLDTDNGPIYGVVSFDSSISGGSSELVGNPDFATTGQNNAITIDVLANDVGSGLFILSSNPWSQEGGSVSVVSNKIRYQPKSGFTGEDKLWYVLQDSAGRSTFSAVTINVVSVSSPYPVGNPDSASTALNTQVTINVLSNDTGSGLVLSGTNPWSLKGGSVSISNNRIVYTPKSGFTGEDALWYVFNDSQGRTNSSKVTINVSDASSSGANAAADFYTTARNTGKVLDILSNDMGGSWRAIDTLYQYTAKGGTSYKTPEGKVWYTPKTGFTGEDNFWYVMVDSQGRKRSAQVKINVTP